MADVNARNESGGTPLHDAALGGQAAVVELLLSRGAGLNAPDSSTGATPLFNAASWGRDEVVEVLLAKGADPTLKNKAGQTALAAAEENRHVEIASKLRRAMAASTPARP